MSASRLLVAAILSALASQSLAQEAPAPAAESTPAAPAEASAAPVDEATPAETRSEAASTEMAAALTLLALKPVLGEDGMPSLDAEGQPVLAFQPVAEDAALLPGDQVRYVFTLENPGPMAQNLEVLLDVPAAALLKPDSVAASRTTAFQLGSTSGAVARLPLLIEVDGHMIPASEWLANPVAYDALIAKIERLDTGESVTISYDLTVR